MDYDATHKTDKTILILGKKIKEEKRANNRKINMKQYSISETLMQKNNSISWNWPFLR